MDRESTLAPTAELPELLAARLKSPLPGWRAERQFQPELAFGRHFGCRRRDMQLAAVLVLLYLDAGHWKLPLTLRPAHLVDHASQVSLPGGMIDQGERSSDAALRELSEELGVEPGGVELLGELSSVYVFRSNFQITPWVAVARQKPLWRPSPAEVAELLEVPLAHLGDPNQHGLGVQTFGPLKFSYPYIDYQSHHVWGATSLILGELLATLAELKVTL